MNYKERLAEAKRLFNEAKEIYARVDAGEEVDAQDLERAETLIVEAKKQQTMAGQMKEIKDGAELLEKMDVEVEPPDPVETAPANFKDWSEYLRACWYAMNKNASLRKDDERLQYFSDNQGVITRSQVKDMSEGVGASGGFLVPAEFRAELQSVMGEMSIVRPRATIIRMARRQVNIPVLDQTGTTAGVPHWFGGLTFYWFEEAQEKTESDASFREIELVAHKLIGYTRASDELVADSVISLSDFLSGPLGFAGGVAWMEDYAFINGTGAGQPLGVINAGATIGIPRTAVATPIQYTDLVNMLEAFLPTANGGWIVTQQALSNLLLMNGPTGNPSYLWGDATRGAPNTLLGLPVTFSEKNPAVGTAGDVILADWSYYLIGDRQAQTIESTQYDRWRYDQTSWRVVHRVDGQPWLSAPLTYQDGATQVSPFVILTDKST